MEVMDGVASLTVTFQRRAETSGTETPVLKCPSAEKSQRPNGQRRDGGAQTSAPKCHVPCSPLVPNLTFSRGVYPYLPMATNAPWSILAGMNKKFNIKL